MGKFQFRKLLPFKKEKGEPSPLLKENQDEVKETLEKTPETETESLKEIPETLETTEEQEETTTEEPEEEIVKWYPMIQESLAQQEESTEESEENPELKEEKIEDETTEEKTSETLEGPDENLVFLEEVPPVKKISWQAISRLSALIIVCLLVILGTFYFISPLNRLQNIQVKGNQRIATSEILKASGLKTAESLWPQVFTKKEAAEKIKNSNPEIKKVTVTFSPLNQMAIQLEEYPIDALLKEGDNYYPILENGYVVKNKKSPFEEDLPVLIGFDNQELIMEFLTIYHQIPKKIIPLIDEIHYTGNGKNKKQVTLNMSDGNQVIARFSTLNRYLPKYPQVAAEMQENGVVDMEAGIFSYPYGNEEKAKKETEKETKTETKQNVTNRNDQDKNVSQKEDKENDLNFIPDITQLPAQKEEKPN